MTFKTETQSIENYDPESPAMKCLYGLENYLAMQESKDKKKADKKKK